MCHSPKTPRRMEGRFTARTRKPCGIWQRRWLPALCRTPPARSPPPEASCGRCYNDKRGSEKRRPNSTSENFRKHGTHVRDALRLQTQKSFPHEQQFGGEVWYTLNPHHEISNHLTHVTKKWETEKYLPDTSHGATPVFCCSSTSYFDPRCVVSVTIHGVLQKSRPPEITFMSLSAIQLTSGLPVPVSDPSPSELWPRSSPAPITRLPAPWQRLGDSPLMAWKDRSFRAEIITKSSSWQDVDCSKSSILNSTGFSAAAWVFVMLQS